MKAVSRRARGLRVLALLGAVQCNPAPRGRANVDTALVDLELRAVEPGTVLQGTTLVITGDAFVDDPWGQSTLVLDGEIETGSGTDGRIARLPARFVDFTRLEVDIDAAAFAQLGDDGNAAMFTGTAQVEVLSTVDGRVYRSRATGIQLQIASSLDPAIAVLTPSSVIFPNEPLAVSGSGLLLGDEGTTSAILDGCFTPAGGDSCAPVPTAALSVTPIEPLERTDGVFAFEPRVVGIEPGRFEGTVTFQNEHASGEVTTSPSTPVTWDLVEPTLYGVDTMSASLGRYVTIEGAGFLGGDAGGDTVLRFDGIFTPDDSGIPIELDELLFPEFTDGRHVRYVVNEEDGLAAAIDIRHEPGLLEGLVTPVISYGGVEVEGTASPLGFRLESVRQVVWVNFTPAYKEGLRAFGLRAIDSRIRERALEVIRRDFATLGVEIRDEEPTDYALFAEVDIGGRDPNGLGLLGYDNTPGKDTDNLRLYDRIGGANAQTQEDGFPGYGGVFIESLFGYSEHPGDLAEPVRPDARFDLLFDPFRPDVGGRPVLAADLADIPEVDPSTCLVAEDRPHRIACAIHALGTLVGSTISHELGHSLGLADPYGPSIHNTGDQANRLMDADRPFEERAELEGAGPSRFCAEEYEYLRRIVPSTEPFDQTSRPGCY